MSALLLATLLTLTPASGVQGQMIEITTSIPLAGVAAFEPAGNITISNARGSQFTIRISQSATPGVYTFIYTPVDAAEPARVLNAFTVHAAEAVIGPRVDVVSPSTLQAGQRYTLKIQGKNLAADTTIDFGKDITVVGVPMFTSPTDATTDVIVSLAAAPGVLAAVATNSSGSNRGPGGVMIAAAPTAPIIILDEPRDPIVATDQTSFSWHESLPGTATFFLFRLTDEDGKFLFSAQVTKTSFALTAADLDIMSIGKTPKRVRWSVHGIANKTEKVEESEERAVLLTNNMQ